MAWSPSTSEGFVLAATIQGDRHAVSGVARLSGTAADQVTALSDALRRLDDHERRARIAAISHRMTAPMSGLNPNMPARALALLAPFSERSLGNTWLRQAPPTRAGYAAEPGLRRVLRAIAERGTWHA